MKTKLRFSVALGLCTALIATAALSESHGDKAAAAAVEARHGQMELMAYHIGMLGGMAKGETPYDAETAKAAAGNLHMMASLARQTMWTPGTEQGSAPDSRAKAEIWSDPDGFAKAFDALEMASAALADVAGNDLDALKGGLGAVGKGCGDCHESYRGPKN